MEIRYLFSKYILAGVFNTLFGYLILILLVYFGVNPYLSFLLAHIIGVNINFLVYSHLVFKNNNKRNLYKFIIVYSLLYLSGNLLLLISDLSGFNAYEGIFTLIIVNTALGYTLNKNYVFKRV